MRKRMSNVGNATECCSLLILAILASYCFGSVSPIMAATWRIPGDAPTIQAGIDSADAGDTVLVAAGMYYEHNIALKNGVAVLSESGAGVTTINGNAGGTCVVAIGSMDSSAVLDGFTITNGSGGSYPSSGGGILCRSGASPRISNNVITENEVERSNVGYGGGIYCYGSGTDPVIRDNVITYNYASQSGGGVGCDTGADPVLLRNVIAHNRCGGNGGGIYLYGSSPSIVENLVWADSCGTDGSGVFMSYYSHPEIRGNTFWNNVSLGSSQMGTIAIAAPEPQPDIVNNIIAGDSDYGIYSIGSASNPTISCNSVWGNALGPFGGTLANQCGSNGNICADPLLCDPENENFHLQNGSPCVNTSGCGLIGARGVGCQGTGTPISIIAPSIAAQGTPFAIGIQVGGDGYAVQDLFGLTLEIGFADVNLVEALEVRCTDQDGQPLDLGDDVICFGDIDNDLGIISAGVTRKAGAEGVNGQLQVLQMYLRFRDNATPDDCVTLSFREVTAVDPNGAAIELDTSATAETVCVVEGCVVWPGDANNDGIVDERDILPLGRHWHRTGPARNTSGCSWNPELVNCWSPLRATYADANGNGQVEVQDVLCIGLNWHRTHFTSDTPQPAPFKAEITAMDVSAYIGAFEEMLTFLKATPDQSEGIVEVRKLLTRLVEEGRQNSTPARSSLEQNMPNPFNPTTTISFVLEEPTHVKLVVFNIAGQYVRTLQDRAIAAGTHQVTWNGKNDRGEDVSSGIYFYRADIGTEVFTRRMNLVR